MPKFVSSYSQPNSVLRALRGKVGLSQRQAAAEAGVNPVQWAQIETGCQEKTFSALGWLAVWDRFGDDLTKLGYTLADAIRGRRKPGVKRAA